MSEEGAERPSPTGALSTGDPDAVPRQGQTPEGILSAEGDERPSPTGALSTSNQDESKAAESDAEQADTLGGDQSIDWPGVTDALRKIFPNKDDQFRALNETMRNTTPHGRARHRQSEPVSLRSCNENTATIPLQY